MHAFVGSLAWLVAGLLGAEGGDDLRTVAERSGFRATARSGEVLELCRALARSSKLAHFTELGKTSEGRPIPALVLADPPVTSPSEASRSGKLVVLLLGNIHAGEVCGKEALPILAREVLAEPHPALLRDLILVVVPNLNPDGNDRVSKDNRPGQIGPEEGMGQRANARGLDLNRDFIKLDAPETRALVRFVNRWDPHVVIDTHTTNGSHHRYTITYDGPKNPAGDRRVIDYVRGTFLPRAGAAFEKATGLHAFFYGNFDRDHTRWTTYPATPRYGTTYLGLRNRVAILSEAYAYAPYKTRVLATRDFVRACLEGAAAHKAEIRRLLADARAATAAARGDRVAIRSEATPFPEPVKVLGFVEDEGDGRRKPTGEPKDYTAQVVQKFEPTATVTRPTAYLVPARFTAAVEALQRHGLGVDELREDIELDVEAYRVEKVRRGSRAYEGHEPVEVTASAGKNGPRRVEAGTLVVSTSQPLGTLAVYLLEPGSDDGLATWNFFDDGLTDGSEFPVLRLPRPAPLLTTPARPLPEDRRRDQPITFAMLRSGGMARSFFGGPGGSPRWVDGGHWLQVKQGRLYRVEARTGKAEPFVDPETLARALASVPALDVSAASSLSRQTSFEMDPAREGALFRHDDDLYYARFDGTSAARLTRAPGHEGLTSFSPDGRFVAFVRGYDLYAVDVATGTERALTTGGGDTLRHGETDWVYGEEIFNRSSRAYWWSPDSARVAFLEFDDRPVPAHTVLNDAQSPRQVEPTPYPRSGEPNPKVRLGVAEVAGGATAAPLRWADLSDYPADATLISHVGWWPDGRQVYAYVQDRAQTWLDVVTVPARGGVPKRLFRETTRAWVEGTDPPAFLDDGSFLFLSERDGYKHIYRYKADGALERRLTEGPWEVRSVVRADGPSGWVYFTATRDNPLAVNLDRVKLDGGPVERLTKGGGSHHVTMSPDGRLFLDSWSDPATPPRLTLYEAGGARVRAVDTNPADPLEGYRLAPRQRVTIPARDGFPLEAEVITPPDLDPKTTYPVWLMTYAGPHMPTVTDAWGGAHMNEQALAQEGVVVFRVDPRSASGKGAASAWSAYKKLGVRELDDLKDAVAWLVKDRPYVDPKRVGIEGHSYGGFMTAFAMTHSDVFAAGIAGAPVTDWRDYDSIYTERYMGLPRDNPEGYDASSVVKAARALHGRLLIAHGAIDDNVSVRNTLRLAHALQAADKDFELMIYPGSRHGGFGPHFSRLRVEFIRRTLGGPKPR